MSRTSLLPVIVLLLAAGCGGGPTAPSSSRAPAVVLLPGTYTLTVSQGTAPGGLSGGATTSLMVCLSSGLSAPTSVTIDVPLVADGERVRGSVDQLSLVLAPSGVGVSGPAQGRVTTATGLGLTLGEGDQPTILSGVVNSRGALEGTIEGRVQLSFGTSTSSCNQNSFRLTPK